MIFSSALWQRINSAMLMLFFAAAVTYYGQTVLLLSAIIVISLCTYEVIHEVRRSLKKTSYLLIFSLVAYVVLGTAGFVLLRQEFGISIISWLLVVVCSVDIFAFAGGKLIGGIKLCPKISPNKTWAGFFSGIIASVIFSNLLGRYISGIFSSIVISLIFAIISVVGDLFISWAKRRIGIKDFGNLIPGHGGILDRLDSLLLASSCLYCLLKWLS